MKKYISTNKKSVFYKKFTKNYIYKLSQNKYGRMTLCSLGIQFDYIYFCYNVAQNLKNMPCDKLSQKRPGQVALAYRVKHSPKFGDRNMH